MEAGFWHLVNRILRFFGHMRRSEALVCRKLRVAGSSGERLA